MDPQQPGRPPLDAATLATAPAWARVEVVAEAGSTNALVAARAHDGAEHGLVLVAEHQTAGRGRLGRTWETPARAALTFSVLVRPDDLARAEASRSWRLLPLLTGTAVVAGIGDVGGPECGLKWPNDVLHADLKLGGLLAERVETPNGPAAVLGIGLNVSTTRSELPVTTATSLLLATGAAPERAALLVAVLGRLGERLAVWVAGRDAALLDEYRRRCTTVGMAVRVDLPGGDSLAGTAVRVAGDGALVLDVAGREVAVSAGDVIHVRAASGPSGAGEVP